LQYWWSIVRERICDAITRGSFINKVMFFLNRFQSIAVRHGHLAAGHCNFGAPWLGHCGPPIDQNGVLPIWC
jgi:hypothetical protein